MFGYVYMVILMVKLGKNLADGNRRAANLNPPKYVGLMRHLAIEANRDVIAENLKFLVKISASLQ